MSTQRKRPRALPPIPADPIDEQTLTAWRGWRSNFKTHAAAASALQAIWVRAAVGECGTVLYAARNRYGSQLFHATQEGTFLQ